MVGERSANLPIQVLPHGIQLGSIFAYHVAGSGVRGARQACNAVAAETDRVGGLGGGFLQASACAPLVGSQA